MKRTCSIGLLVAAALALAAILAAPSGASAAVCPQGQSGTPPYCVKPPPKPCPPGEIGVFPYCTKPPVTPTFEVESVAVKGKSTSIVVEVNLPGSLNVHGKGIKSKTRRVLPGTDKVRVGLTRKAKRQLRRKGKLRLKIDLRYTPDGGTPITKTVKVSIKAGKKHHHRRHHKKRHHRHRG
jgi:hypothetical protein